MKILLAEYDRRSIAESLAEALATQNYIVDVVSEGEESWDFVKTFDYDLCLLDIILPKLDRISLCRRLHSHDYQMPIMLLTARDATADIVAGLDTGTIGSHSSFAALRKHYFVSCNELGKLAN